MFSGINDMMFGGGMRHGQFDTRLRCFSAPFFHGADSQKINELNHGGKILLPNSALDTLIRLNIQYPMMFKITNVNPEHQKATHCGVLEFLAEEGRCYVPAWMMRQLGLGEGDHIQIQYVSLPSATYAKFKPQSVDFLQISNPRAVLEVELRKFACLTKNDIIAVQYNNQLLEFLVQEVKPGNAVTIIECDMNVEFDAPEGYVEPTYERKPKNVMPDAPEMFIPAKSQASSGFTSGGYRLDGRQRSKNAADKKDKKAAAEPEQTEMELKPLEVFEDYEPGHLSFIRYAYRNRSVLEQELKEQNCKLAATSSGAKRVNVVPFQGGGHTLRGAK
ncbi:hypothetical protein L596_022186 [Steinernema carpocapsae]|uniref:Ubiquitin fusion degradation protein UFD1 n=1 Tax=Steinernema carpocapsae TaxID=34508 RepID=A0A4U5MKZ4_STECR|nr:hypothetical protein L596_022186 [Steinernema carpocapsae]